MKNPAARTSVAVRCRLWRACRQPTFNADESVGRQAVLCAVRRATHEDAYAHVLSAFSQKCAPARSRR